MYFPDTQEEAQRLKVFKRERRMVERAIVRMARELAKLTEELDSLDTRETAHRDSLEETNDETPA